jgi:hypothetical protein
MMKRALLLGIVALTLLSPALAVLQIYSYDEPTQTATIADWIGLSKVADVKLIENTEQCLIDCSATIMIIPAKDFTSDTLINFIDKQEKIKNIDYTTYIKDIEKYTETIQTPYNDTCEQETFDNKTNKSLGLEKVDCIKYKEEEKDAEREIWVETKDLSNYKFTKGEAVYIKLNGKNKIGENTDWIPTIYNLDIKEMAWWNSTWLYKQQVNLSTASGYTGTNYQVGLNITYTANMQADFDDLRFTEDTEATELSYWIESKSNSNWAYIWVKVPANITTTATTIYMYYGNPSATTTSNGTNTFEFFDNFNRANSGTVGNNWVIDRGTFNITNNKLLGGINNNRDSIHQEALNFSGNFSIDAEVYVATDVPNGGYAGLGYTNGDMENSGTRWFRTFVDVGATSKWWIGGSAGNYETIVTSDLRGTTATYSIVADVPNKIVGIYQNYILMYNTTMASDTLPSSAWVAPMSYAGQNTWDDFRVRKWAGLEPTATFGAEQTSNQAPQVNLNLPANSTTINNTQNINFNFTATDDLNTTLSCNLTLDGATNQTNNSVANNTLTNFLINGIAYGNHTWNVNCTDGINIGTNTTRYFWINDTIAPVTSLISPSNNTHTDNNNTNFTCGATDGVALQNISLYWDYNGTWLNNITTNISGTSNSTYFYKPSMNNGTFIWNCYACDTSNNCAFAPANYSLFIQPMSVVDDTGDFETMETDYHTFYANVSAFGLNASLLNATFYFESSGTYAPTTTTIQGDYVYFTKYFQIPKVCASADPDCAGDTTGRDFYWIIYYNSSNTLNSTTRTNLIKTISLFNSSGAGKNNTLIFKSYNEETGAAINIKFYPHFTAWRNYASMNRTYSFNNTAGSPTHTIYMWPDIWDNTTASGVTYNASMDSTYASTLTPNPYITERHYYLRNAQISDIPQTIYLYLLNASSSSTLEVSVVDSGYLPIKEAIVKTQRYYPVTDTYLTVEEGLTNNFGKTLAHVVLENVTYRFVIDNSTGSTIYTSTPMQIYCPIVPCTIEFIVGQEITNPYIPLNNMSDISYTFVYNNATGNVRFEFDDTSGLSPTVTLLTQKEGGTYQATICNTSTTSTSGTLLCSLTNMTGDFFSTANITRGTDSFVTRLQTSLNNEYLVYGNEGLLIGFLIMITMILMALWSPVASLVMTVAGFIVLRLLGIMMISTVMLGAIVIIIIIMLWKMRA